VFEFEIHLRSFELDIEIDACNDLNGFELLWICFQAQAWFNGLIDQEGNKDVGYHP
jgi:hypothetical protein